jgi:hypothetical protein
MNNLTYAIVGTGILLVVNTVHGLTINGADIKNNHCVEYKDNFLDGHKEVIIHKTGSDTSNDNADLWTWCNDTWRQIANYLINSLGYRVTTDFEDNIFLRGNIPIISQQENKPYKDCLQDASKTFIECQEFNPRN